MYFTAVTDHVYGAYLVTLEPFPRWTKRDALVFLSIAAVFWSLPCGMLHSLAMQGLCLHCAFCGEIEHVEPGEQAQFIKVSRSHCSAE